MMLPHFLRTIVCCVLLMPVLAEQALAQDESESFSDDAAWMRKRMTTLVQTSRGQLADGQIVFYADGTRHYNLIFTRGFAYLQEWAGDLIAPDEKRGFIEYLLAGQRADGCIPDRVNSQGRAIYSPGPDRAPLADHALDNAAFLASATCQYVNETGDVAFFRKVEPSLRRGLDFIRRAPNGLVFNPGENPQCVYGFTDIVQKTGHLLFSSVLYYRACGDMEAACKRTKCGDPSEYARRAQLIRKSIGILWDRESGAYWAADGQCRQLDIWGTAFVLYRPGLASPEQEEKALGFLVARYPQYAQHGQIRHLLVPETWQATFVDSLAGEYQNGAYWATPLHWFVPVLARRDPELAQKTLANCLADFRSRGIHEWINGDQVVLPDYMVSAASVYSLLAKDQPDR